jgi:3-oxoacyl-[acyl-carrier-protein] synthase-3
MSNRDLEQLVHTSEEWIVQRTGIRERRILESELAASDLATAAARRACEDAGIAPEQIDCIVLATITGDVRLPATAVHVQRKLGARAGGMAMDISAACSGFLYALAVVDGFVTRGAVRCAVVIGVEVLSRVVDWTDRNTCVLFGDGAGAALVVPERDGRGLLSSHLFADGAFADLLHIPGGPTQASRATGASPAHFVTMNGREVFRHAVTNMTTACVSALRANGVAPEDVSCVIAHQANLRIIEAVAERVGIPIDKFFVNVADYGNTSSASIPIALDEAVRQFKIAPGDLVLMTALGAGLTWGSVLIKW